MRAEEALATAQTPLEATLKQGLDAISNNQVVEFTKYVKLILPLDGFVYWVKADLLSPAAAMNAMSLNGVAYNTSPMLKTAATVVKVKGSLHYASDSKQEEVANYTSNRMVFTAQSEIQDFNEIGDTVLYIATFDGIRFAFSQRGLFYRQAGLYHYVGDAVYADMASQVVDSPIGFDARNVVVSNSLPVWLSLNGYEPGYPTGIGNPALKLFPSFLVPDNMQPPYAAVHIPPDSTAAIASAPALDQTSSQEQLVSETVRITIYGTRNYNALDFVACVSQFSLDTDIIGIMNQPVIRDEKRIQNELSTIAMKKSVEFQINYHQTRMRDVARELIAAAVPSFVLSPLRAAAADITA